MTLDEIAADLPHVLHDAFLQTLSIDYTSRQARFGLHVCVGDPDAKSETERGFSKGGIEGGASRSNHESPARWSRPRVEPELLIASACAICLQRPIDGSGRLTLRERLDGLGQRATVVFA